MGNLPNSIKKFFKRSLQKLFSPSIRSADLQRVLDELRVKKDRPVLVHSSLSGLGYLPSGPQTLLDGILAHLGPQGNIVLPTHSWNLMNRGLRTFNVRETPSCVGAVTEWFRKRPGVIRSLHPTHSVAAMGPNAEELTQNHENASTPCGLETPYHRLLEHDATILFFGAPLDTNTSYHCCEALAGVPYLLQAENCEFELIDRLGNMHKRNLVLHQAGVARDLVPLNDKLKQLGILRGNTLGKGQIRAIHGRAFMEYLCKELIQNPDYLLKSKII